MQGVQRGGQQQYSGEHNTRCEVHCWEPDNWQSVPVQSSSHYSELNGTILRMDWSCNHTNRLTEGCIDVSAFMHSCVYACVCMLVHTSVCVHEWVSPKRLVLYPAHFLKMAAAIWKMVQKTTFTFLAQWLECPIRSSETMVYNYCTALTEERWH